MGRYGFGRRIQVEEVPDGTLGPLPYSTTVIIGGTFYVVPKPWGLHAATVDSSEYIYVGLGNDRGGSYRVPGVTDADSI